LTLTWLTIATVPRDTLLNSHLTLTGILDRGLDRQQDSGKIPNVTSILTRAVPRSRSPLHLVTSYGTEELARRYWTAVLCLEERICGPQCNGSVAAHWTSEACCAGSITSRTQACASRLLLPARSLFNFRLMFQTQADVDRLVPVRWTRRRLSHQ
jgi:hypothetical protein